MGCCLIQAARLVSISLASLLTLGSASYAPMRQTAPNSVGTLVCVNIPADVSNSTAFVDLSAAEICYFIDPIQGPIPAINATRIEGTQTPTPVAVDTATQTPAPSETLPPIATTTPTQSATPSPLATPTQAPTTDPSATQTALPTPTATRTPGTSQTPSALFSDTFDTEASASAWRTNRQGNAQCTATWADAALRLDVTATGAFNFHCQLERSGLALQADHTYRLTFTAYSTLPRTFGIKVMQAGDKFTTFLGENTYNLTVNAQTFTETWIQPVSEPNAKVSFRAALELPSVFVDSVALADIGAVSVVTQTPPPQQTPTSVSTPAPTSVTPATVAPTAVATPVGAAWGLLPDGTRNKYERPFASNAYRNVAIGQNAIYAPAGIHLICGGYCTNLKPDQDIILLRDMSGQPVWDVYQMPGNGWDEQNRCADIGSVIDRHPFPKGWAIPANGENNSLAVLMPDGKQIKQNQPITNCSRDGKLISRWIDDSVDIYGVSPYGAHGGSGLGGAAFAIRIGELTAGRIEHVIGINLDAHVYYNRNCSHSWPAKQVDGYCGSGNNYGGTNTYLRPGARLALRPDFDISQLRTPPGRIIAQAAIDYGFIVGDDTTWNNWALWAEQNDRGSVVKEFAGLWPQYAGFSMDGNHQSDAFYLDMVDIMTAIQIITNDSEQSMGGGGIPRKPAAALIGN